MAFKFQESLANNITLTWVNFSVCSPVKQFNPLCNYISVYISRYLQISHKPLTQSKTDATPKLGKEYIQKEGIDRTLF